MEQTEQWSYSTQFHEDQLTKKTGQYLKTELETI
jgi:hypothetical protein